MVHLVDGADDVPVVAVVGQTGVEETGRRAASLSVNRSNNNRLNVIRDMNVTHCPSTRGQIVKITRLGMAPLLFSNHGRHRLHPLIQAGGNGGVEYK